MRICNGHYSFPPTVSLTAGLMCFRHFKMLIDVQGMPHIYILLTGNLPCLSRVRWKQKSLDKIHTFICFIDDLPKAMLDCVNEVNLKVHMTSKC